MFKESSSVDFFAKFRIFVLRQISIRAKKNETKSPPNFWLKHFLLISVFLVSCWVIDSKMEIWTGWASESVCVRARERVRERDRVRDNLIRIKTSQEFEIPLRSSIWFFGRNRDSRFPGLSSLVIPVTWPPLEWPERNSGRTTQSWLRIGGGALIAWASK